MSSWNSASFLIHLFVSAPPSTSAEDKTHFGFQLQQLFSFRSSSLKLSAKSWVHVPSFGAPRLPLYAMAARIDCSRAQLGLNKVAHCPSICHALQVKCIAMSGMPIFIHETHYDPCSQAKIGGTLRQLDKRNVYCSTRNLSVQMAGILLQTEIDSCQTKVSVPVNTLNWGFQVLCYDAASRILCAHHVLPRVVSYKPVYRSVVSSLSLVNTISFIWTPGLGTRNILRTTTCLLSVS